MKRKKKIIIGVSIAILVGALAFALSPTSGELFAGNNRCRQVVEGSNSAGAVWLNCRKVTFYYNEETCKGKCAVIPSLPNDANQQLETYYTHKIITSKVYVRTINEEQNPTDTWYTVCFSPNDADDVRDATIYAFHPVTGWSPQSYFRDAAGNLCAAHLGEASFALMGWEK